MAFPQATPVRPVPGAFLNTPAIASRFQTGGDPVRRQLFPVSDNQTPAASGGATSGNMDAPPQPAAMSRGGTTAASAAAASSSGTVATAQGGGLAPLNPLPPPRAENIPPVLRAAKAINAFLQLDEGFPDLDSYCRRKTV